MDYNTDWSNIPRKSKTASVKKPRRVHNARVVQLDRAFIRGSTVSGCFKLADGAEIKTYAGRQRIEVECLWFGRKPKTSWMHITLLSEPRFQNGYSGEVVLDIRY